MGNGQGTGQRSGQSNEGMTHSSDHQHPTTVDNPSTIIATIPGTLGYYPHESVVVIGLVASEATDSVYLGPVLRADLGRVRELTRYLGSAPVDTCIAFLGVLVTRVPGSGIVRDAVEELEQLQRDNGEPLIDVLWHVSEIAHGTPYSMVFGPEPAELGMFWPELAWERGVVGSVMDSPAMEAMRANGTLPALDRTDTFSYFEPVVLSGKEEHQIASLTEEALARSAQLRVELTRGSSRPASVVHQACTALINAPAQPIIGADEPLTIAETVPDQQAQCALATVLARPTLRDCIIGEAIRHPQESASALLAVARSFRGIIRANALSVWALVAISRGLSSWASAALHCAQEEVPEHSMSAICMEVLALGEQKKLVTTILEGCELACEKILGTATPPMKKSA
nr:Uncharacterised protein [Streptococcus thermophilus]